MGYSGIPGGLEMAQGSFRAESFLQLSLSRVVPYVRNHKSTRFFAVAGLMLFLFAFGQVFQVSTF